MRRGSTMRVEVRDNGHEALLCIDGKPVARSAGSAFDVDEAVLLEHMPETAQLVDDLKRSLINMAKSRVVEK